MRTADDEVDTLRDLLSGAEAGSTPLLPLLQAVKQRVGHVSPGAIRMVAQALNLSRAEVHGVVSFYGDLREAPVGRHVVQVCMAEACQSVGCRALMRHAAQALGVSAGTTTSDGRVHLEAVYCLGNCALGPAVRIGDRVHGAVTPARFDALIAQLGGTA
ncbi:MAG: NAD(P)H-dependent oxidoreductase subunit E [Gemmatimonadaceae bacterium]|nr:NAD(P)H-dependent oxidoreductase subunit E [Gemmatimonadaceae bacterium]